jgi:hypothetical protein
MVLVGANKNSIKIIGEPTPMYAQGYSSLIQDIGAVTHLTSFGRH